MSEKKTKWESIVSDEALTRARTLRSKTFIESKERRVALPELIEEGWTGRLAEKQEAWLTALSQQGYAAMVCYGWDCAAEEIVKYLEMR